MPCIPTAQPCQVLTFCHIWFKIFFPRDNTSQIQVEPQGMCLSCPLSSHSPPSMTLPADAGTPAPWGSPPRLFGALLWGRRQAPRYPPPTSSPALSLGLLHRSMYTSALPP